jgi:hypothetical protein
MHFIDKIFFFIKTTLYIRQEFKNKLTQNSVIFNEKTKNKSSYSSEKNSTKCISDAIYRVFWLVTDIMNKNFIMYIA